ncbi:MAG TPA: hemerythrin domain-containing protein [Jatrophihabitans sp.]|nr:hemerythrin domain-containing protein [Jatrophihabitans sp.]
MTATIDRPADVVSFLKAQHMQIKTLLEQVAGTTGEQRQAAFDQVRRLLAVHETAEEEVVHPRARREITDGEEVVAARLAEEHSGKKMLAEIEKLDVDSAEFEEKFRVLRDDIVKHAEAEEREEFEQLGAELDDVALARMRNAVKIAEAVAPTHPHAGAESPAANLLAGPFAAMLDRTRDLLAGKN